MLVFSSKSPNCKVFSNFVLEALTGTVSSAWLVPVMGVLVVSVPPPAITVSLSDSTSSEIASILVISVVYISQIFILSSNDLSERFLKNIIFLPN